jgi:hypothetical protein
MRRQYDPKPVLGCDGESLQEYVDRTICNCPAGRLWREWGWPDPRDHSFQFFEVSWVPAAYFPDHPINPMGNVIEIPSEGI